MPVVTDPALLAQLNAPDTQTTSPSKVVTDPAILAQLNAPDTPEEHPFGDAYTPVKLKDDPRLHDPKYRDELRGYSKLDMMIDEGKKGISSLAGMPGDVTDLLSKEVLRERLQYENPKLSKSDLDKKVDDKIAEMRAKGSPIGSRGSDVSGSVKKFMGVKDRNADPNSTVEKALGGGANFLGQNIVLSPSSLIKSGIRKLPQNLVTEGVSSMGGGAGFRLGEEYGAKKDKQKGGKPFYQPLFGAAGGIAGGGLSEIATSQALPKGIRTIKNKLAPVLTKENADNAIKGGMSRDLRGALSADPEAVARLRESLKTSGELNTKFGTKFSPDLAQATGSNSVENLKQRLDLGSPESVSRDLTLQRQNKEALETGKNAAFPAADTRRVAQADFDKTMADLKAKSTDVGKKQEALTQEIQNSGFTKEKGERLRQLGEEEFDVAYKAQQGLYNELDVQARNAGFEVDSKPMALMIRDIKKDRGNMFQEPQVQSALGEIEGILKNKTKPEEKAQTFFDESGKVISTVPKKEAEYPKLSWDDYRSLMKHINNAYQGTSNVYVRQFLDQFKKSAREQADAVAPDLTAKLDQVNELFGTVIQDTFRKGAYGEMTAEGAYGYRTVGSQVVRKSFLSKGEEGADRFIKTFGDHPEAKELMENAVTDEFARASIKNGMFDPKAARAYLARKEVQGFLSKFPDLKRKLSNSETQGQMLLERAKTLEKMANDQADTAIAKIAKTPDTIGLLKNTVNDYRMTQEITKQVKRNPEFGRGVMRGYADVMWNEKNPAEFIDKNEGNLKPVFDAMGPGHWDNIKLLSKGKEIAGRTSPTPMYRAETEIDPAKRILGTSTSGLFSRIRNSFYTGMTSKSWALVDVGGKFLFKVSQDDAKKMMEAAFYDPKLAEDLAKAEHKVNLPQFSNAGASEFVDDVVERLKMHGIRVELNTAQSVTSPDRQKDVQRRVKAAEDIGKGQYGRLLGQ